mmetsp:Transcript_70690/g.143558  ORF Transcript_70690/g.143558 Transcript_70690/m.143558 type:complete len:128 (-) Transcript_70690:808-1191(-)
MTGLDTGTGAAGADNLGCNDGGAGGTKTGRLGESIVSSRKRLPGGLGGEGVAGLPRLGVGPPTAGDPAEEAASPLGETPASHGWDRGDAAGQRKFKRAAAAESFAGPLPPGRASCTVGGRGPLVAVA